MTISYDSSSALVEAVESLDDCFGKLEAFGASFDCPHAASSETNIQATTSIPAQFIFLFIRNNPHVRYYLYYTGRASYSLIL
ncbi:hypothetical protein D3C78_1074900 [compost metagenome]